MKESKAAGGRIAVHVPDHPKANNSGYVLKHRYVMEQYIGRYLSSDEHVHHCNEDKSDNSIENLELMLHREHMRHRNNLSKRRVLDYDAIKKLRDEGLGYKRIAKVLGYSRNSV